MDSSLAEGHPSGCHMLLPPGGAGQGAPVCTVPDPVCNRNMLHVVRQVPGSGAAASGATSCGGSSTSRKRRLAADEIRHSIRNLEIPGKPGETGKVHLAPKPPPRTSPGGRWRVCLGRARERARIDRTWPSAAGLGHLDDGRAFGRLFWGRIWGRPRARLPNALCGSAFLHVDGGHAVRSGGRRRFGMGSNLGRSCSWQVHPDLARSCGAAARRTDGPSLEIGVIAGYYRLSDGAGKCVGNVGPCVPLFRPEKTAGVAGTKSDVC